MRNGAQGTEYVADSVTRSVGNCTEAATRQPDGLLIQIDRALIALRETRRR